MVDGIFFTSLVFRQKRTVAPLYANWCNVTKYETVRLEAIRERMDIAYLPIQEPGWLKKRQKELKEAIKQYIKSNKKEYLPIIYLMKLFSRKTYIDIRLMF
jgi:hypothetical protein